MFVWGLDSTTFPKINEKVHYCSKQVELSQFQSDLAMYAYLTHKPRVMFHICILILPHVGDTKFLVVGSVLKVMESYIKVLNGPL